MKNKLGRWLAGAAGCVVAASLAFAAQAADPIKIGVTFDAAKQASYYSQLQKGSLEVYEKELNAKGGVIGRPISFVFEDDENNPTTAAQKVEKLADEGVSFIIQIGSSATGLAAQSKAQEIGIPNGSPMNVADKLTSPKVPSFYFRTALRDNTATAAIIAYMKAKKPNPRVAVVRDNSETGLVSSDAQIAMLKAAGLEPVAVEQIPTGASSVTAQAVRVKTANPDFVLLAGGSIPELANYVKAHRSLNNPAEMIGGNLLAVPSFPELSGKAANGVIFADAVDMTRSDVKAVEAKLVAEKGKQLANSVHAIFAWAYADLVVDAIRQANSADRQAVRAAMEDIKDHKTLLGPAGTVVRFKPGMHDALDQTDQVVLRLIEDGKFGGAVKR